MYLPTFWKMCAEATAYRLRHVAGYGVPVGVLLIWVINPSLYNWTYSTIIPPPRGVPKRG